MIPDRFPIFIAASCVVLGGLTGLLIVMPLTAGMDHALGLTLILAGLVFGTLTGYRRRKSRIFLYFSLACVLMLSTLISFNVLA